MARLALRSVMPRVRGTAHRAALGLRVTGGAGGVVIGGGCTTGGGAAGGGAAGGLTGFWNSTGMSCASSSPALLSIETTIRPRWGV